ncbi:hypothetical protein [Chelativorans salis]|uniref:SGNH hydrolase-type esterase domain-containing protein n=1 Tax=Chelativorans salis TaxID=2978478 RepID=A0ABT2LUR3_9HYPH|nr:hypothetical protein [Chelativorans sp. EGI FJ00035]MCT7376924.1 hypothetical protein [Chelativorans sp. EGI FJ00035]
MVKRIRLPMARRPFYREADTRSAMVSPLELSTETAVAGTRHDTGSAVETPTGRVGRKARGRAAAIAGNLLLLGLSIAFVVALFETFLAAFPQFQVQANEGKYLFCSPPYTRHVEHPVFGYTESPGASYFERNSRLDPWYYVRVNEEGFRDNQSHDGERVIVLGDSMLRGTLVNEHETFASLMNQWHPDMGFHIYGVGGYGQANTLELYRDKGATLPHRLVIQQFTLPNDLDDNVERAKRAGDGIEVDFEKITAKTTESTIFLLEVHKFIWRVSSLYRIVYNFSIRSHFENWDARRDIDNALELTRRLLVALAEAARANNADLLLLAIPGWPEIVGRDDGMAPERQREMLRAFVSETANAHLLDVTPRLVEADPSRTYGVIDKHLTPYGHFLVAEVLDQWMEEGWHGGPGGIASEREFVQQPAISPDCSLTDDYLEWVQPI